MTLKEAIYDYYSYFLLLLIILIILANKNFIFKKSFRLIKKGKYEEALIELEIEMETSSEKPILYYGIAYCYYMIGFFKNSIKYFELTLKFNYRKVEIFFFLALLYSYEKNFEKSFKFLNDGRKEQKEANIFSKFTDFQINEITGWIYYNKGETEIALNYYDNAIPGWERYLKKRRHNFEKFSSIYYRIGMIYKLKGEIERARRNFMSSIASSPSSFFGQESKYELEKLEKKK